MHSHRYVARFAAGLVPAIYALLIFGSTVRAHGAGLACPDWPLCFGEVIPRMDFGVFLEFGHRVVAGGISLGWLALGILLFARPAPRAPRVLWGIGTALLAVQIVLGGLTVLHLLAEWTVMGHLVVGNSFMAVALLVALSLRHDPAVVRRPVALHERAWALRLGVLVLAQLALGGLVSSSHAGLACATWPTCDGVSWFPTVSGLVGLQVLHRLTAYALLILAGITAVATGGRGPTGRAALLVVGLVLTQIGLGVANVLLQIPVEVTLAHAGGGAAIVLATTWLNFEAHRAPVASTAPSADLVPSEAT